MGNTLYYICIHSYMSGSGPVAGCTLKLEADKPHFEITFKVKLFKVGKLATTKNESELVPSS